MCKIVHINKAPYDIYIGRHSDPIKGKWGNPFTHKKENTKAEFIVGTRKEAIDAYANWIVFGDGQHLLKDLHELKGKTLGCWCKPKSCHGDILVKLVNDLEYMETQNHGLNFW